MSLMRAGFPVVVAILCMTGCSEPTDIVFTTAIAFGRVTFESGSPIVGVPVDVDLHFEDCDGAGPGGSDNNQGSRVTDGAGFYRRVLVSPFGPAVTQCAVVTVNPNSAPEWPVYREEFRVQMELDYGSRDSTRLDVVIPEDR